MATLRLAKDSQAVTAVPVPGLKAAIGGTLHVLSMVQVSPVQDLS